jgi:hypothetical protein
VKNLIFLLALIMLVPLGSKQNEAFEKNEAERIEYLSHSHKLSSRQVLKKTEGSENTLKHIVFKYALPNNASTSTSLIRKIYLFHSSLLI